MPEDLDEDDVSFGGDGDYRDDAEDEPALLPDAEPEPEPASEEDSEPEPERLHPNEPEPEPEPEIVRLPTSARAKTPGSAKTPRTSARLVAASHPASATKTPEFITPVVFGRAPRRRRHRRR